MLGSLAILLLLQSPRVTVEEIPELADEEVAVLGQIDLWTNPDLEKFKRCVPNESVNFPTTLSAALEKMIFDERETKDLMACSAESCAFNFLPNEIAELQKLKTIEEKKKAFWKFYQNRADGKVGVDSRRDGKFIRSRAKPFDFCQSDALNRLLDDRPLKDQPFRFSVAKYSSQMRPTTRVLQGIHFQDTNGKACYAEAMIFSDHYDLDRVEVWQLTSSDLKPSLKLQIRYRIDLLNTWFRRLNKQTFRNELKRIVTRELDDAYSCLK